MTAFTDAIASVRIDGDVPGGAACGYPHRMMHAARRAWRCV
jgi:hypothetical protein